MNNAARLTACKSDLARLFAAFDAATAKIYSVAREAEAATTAKLGEFNGDDEAAGLAWCTAEEETIEALGGNAARRDAAAARAAIFVKGRELSTLIAKAARRSLPRDVVEMFDLADAGKLTIPMEQRLIAFLRDSAK